jgi:hypothetical protein
MMSVLANEPGSNELPCCDEDGKPKCMDTDESDPVE